LSGERHSKPVCFRSVTGGWQVRGICPDCQNGGVRAGLLITKVLDTGMAQGVGGDDDGCGVR